VTQARQAIPAILIAICGIAMIWHGPIAQPPHYHEFVDTRTLLGIPNALNVLSNVPFLFVGAWGLRAVGMRWPAYAIFLVAIVLTTFGSGFYHWAPDNDRLLWDRIPIALACGALLAGVHADTHPESPPWLPAVLVITAVASCAWWFFTEKLGKGDLRPYLFFQVALVLIPIWQWLADSPRADRIAFGVAVVLYALAKAAEIYDREIYESLGFMSGHTVKHLLSALAAFVLAHNIARRVQRS
jgi:hypothetical protein